MGRFAYMGSVARTAVLATALVAAPLGAQSFREQGGRGDDGVPPGHRPPPGMCRIWIDGVPPGQQPAPTDCATAVRNRPANGRVIFGDDAAKSGKGKPKKFRGVSSARGDDEFDRGREARRADDVDLDRRGGDGGKFGVAGDRPSRDDDGRKFGRSKGRRKS